VIGKAELIEAKPNPRTIVTDLSGAKDWAQAEAAFADGASLYERFNCARGDMESSGARKPKGGAFARRAAPEGAGKTGSRKWTSSRTAPPPRSCRATSSACGSPPSPTSCCAGVVALGGTRLAQATVGTIRLRLLKIAAQVTDSVRRISVGLCSACPMRDVFAKAHERLRATSG